MSKKRKTYSADFKSKVVLELLESGKSINEIASKHSILPNSLSLWKKQFVENMNLAFDKSAVVKEYKEEIEQLKKENDGLAKKLGKTIIEKDWAVGKLKSLDLSTKKDLVDKPEGVQAKNKKIPSLNNQLKMLKVSKKAFYYKSIPPFSSEDDLKLLNKIDEIYTKFPYYGHRRIRQELQKSGFKIGRKRVLSAMEYMGLKAIYPAKKTTIPNKEHKKYPYLLTSFKNKKNQVIVNEVNSVWSADITYIRLRGGFCYLAAIMDWNTKKVLSWKLSSTMDTHLTVSVLKDALDKYPPPEIFNSDQGSQYTAKEHISVLVKNNISISMDGKGRSIDNICIERFWRTLKYEEVYLKEYSSIFEARSEISKYIEIYNSQRLHSAIGYRSPDDVYFKTIEMCQIERDVA
jgi:putative transposase